MAWLGIELLPYIDTERLLQALTKADSNGDKLSTNEKERNINKQHFAIFFVHMKDLSQHKIIDCMPFTELNLIELFTEFPFTIAKEENESLMIKNKVQEEQKYEAAFECRDLIHGEIINNARGFPLGDSSCIKIDETTVPLSDELLENFPYPENDILLATNPAFLSLTKEKFLKIENN